MAEHSGIWSADFGAGVAELVDYLFQAVGPVGFTVEPGPAGPVLVVCLSANVPGKEGRLCLVETLPDLDKLESGAVRACADRIAAKWLGGLAEHGAQPVVPALLSSVRARAGAGRRGPADPGPVRAAGYVAVSVGLPKLDALFGEWANSVYDGGAASLEAGQLREVRRAFVSGLFSALSAASESADGVETVAAWQVGGAASGRRGVGGVVFGVPGVRGLGARWEGLMLPVNLQAYGDELNRRRAALGLGALAWESAAAAVSQRAADRMAVAGQVEHPNVGECVIAGASWFFQPGQLFDLWGSDFGHWAWLYSPTATRWGLAVTGSTRGWWYWAAAFDGLPAALGSSGAPALRPVVGRPAVGSWAEWVRRVMWFRAGRRS